MESNINFVDSESNTQYAINCSISAIWFIATVLVFVKSKISILQLLLTYGKHTTTKQYNTINNIINKNNNILHSLSIPLRLAWSLFYFSGLIWTFVIPQLFHISSPSPFYLPLLLFRIQLLRRLFECLFIHKFSSKRRLPPYHLVYGVSYYIVAAFTFVVPAHRPSVQSLSATLVCVTLFVCASFVQHFAHRALATTKPIVEKYGIPTSPLFRHIVCPHYLAEVLVYLSLAALTQSFPAILNCLFVISSLSMTALDTVQWYKDTFPSHLLPSRRRYAIFPFVL